MGWVVNKSPDLLTTKEEQGGTSKDKELKSFSPWIGLSDLERGASGW